MNHIPQDNLTDKLIGPDGLSKYAVFLPAISSFYTAYIGRQKHQTRGFIPDERIPAGFDKGIAGLDWMNKSDGYFYYKHNLYSAGHANLDVTKPNIKEAMVYDRNRNEGFVLGDSGGFQIGKGVWTADWKDPSCPKALAKRTEVLTWLDTHMDYGMILDIPAWVRKTQKGRESSGISTFAEAITATQINNEFFMKNRLGQCKFLNVVQGSNHAESDLWYSHMKKYCDPKQYSNPFNGWAFGSQQACDPHLTLKRLVTCRFDGLLETGVHDWLHILGNSDMEWVLFLTDIQRAIRKYHNPTLTVSYDCASPFLATVHGNIYNDIFAQTQNGLRWIFPNAKSPDDKKYWNDPRTVKQVMEQDNYFSNFVDSPITARMTIKDICQYGPGHLNKLGKEGRTSWDSFSYALQMSHNVWSHIVTTQEANRKYDLGEMPSAMSILTAGKKSVFHYDQKYCRDLIDEIFATSDYGKATKLIDHYSKYWMAFRGVRGFFGKKAKNSTTIFNDIFQEV